LKRLIVLPLLILLAGGCMKAGPDYTRPAPDFIIPQEYDNAFFTGERPSDDQWWKAFNDPVLNETVARVIFYNHDIRQAASSVMESRAVFEQVDADRYPQVGVAGLASRRQQAIVNPLTGETESVETRLFSLTVPATFEIDLWGRLARASEAGRAELLMAELNRRTVIQSMIAESVIRYLEIRAMDQQAFITEKMIESARLYLDLVEKRYERGLAPVIEVHQARRTLALLSSRLPALIQAAGLSRQALFILQGEYPDSIDQRHWTVYNFEMLDPVPEGLPSELLNRRPDIMAAEARLEAASARIGQARASRFPRLSLTGAFGYADNSLNSFFTPQNEIWHMAAESLQPLYDAGRLAAAQRAAEARFQTQSIIYARVLLNAFGEVEGALLTRQQQVERRKHLAEFLKHAEITEKLAEDRYQRGLINYLDVIDALQATYQAQMEMIEVETVIYANRVRLHRALGGGWDHALAPSQP
jgi:outer membrane protein, multidrug efflux system